MRGASELKWETGLKGVYDAESNNEVGCSSSYFSPVIKSIDIKEIIEEKKVIGKLSDLVPNFLFRFNSWWFKTNSIY